MKHLLTYVTAVGLMSTALILPALSHRTYVCSETIETHDLLPARLILTGSDVNLRQAPNALSPVINNTLDGHEFWATHYVSGYYYGTVVNSDRTGWIKADYVLYPGY